MYLIAEVCMIHPHQPAKTDKLIDLKEHIRRSHFYRLISIFSRKIIAKPANVIELIVLDWQLNRYISNVSPYIHYNIRSTRFWYCTERNSQLFQIINYCVVGHARM